MCGRVLIPATTIWKAWLEDRRAGFKPLAPEQTLLLGWRALVHANCGQRRC